MHNNVVNHLQGGHHAFPVEVEAAFGVAAGPAVVELQHLYVGGVQVHQLLVVLHAERYALVAFVAVVLPEHLLGCGGQVVAEQEITIFEFKGSLLMRHRFSSSSSAWCRKIVAALLSTSSSMAASCSSCGASTCTSPSRST
jgi:hypothetical protein